jgi:hypothetical protein
MKEIAKTSPLIVSSDFDPNASVMGMSQEAALKMAKHLRDTVYTDKVLAVVREICLNAIDEHSIHEIDKSVEVGIRKIDSDYEFYTRDYAKGLSEDGIRNVFGMYGNSSKTNTNLASGFMGIGSKAPFGYTDSYFVVSYFGGKKTVYTCTLGGDDNGTSTGFIYKTHEEDSNESGLEVIVPMKPQDISTFSNKINIFVSHSPYDIKADILGAEIFPIIPKFEKKVGDYNFRLLETPHHFNVKVVYQMGGNTYNSESFNHDGISIKHGHCLVVDIPIGKCSITLSRESFEETERNKKAFSEIENILCELAEEDIAKFRTKNTLQLVEDDLNGMGMFEGDMFKAYAKDIYKDVWGFVGNVRKLEDGDLIKKDNKFLCVTIPNNEASSYWRTKVAGYLKEENKSAYVISEMFNFHSEKNTEHFHFISARKLPYKKVPKDSGRYAVYCHGSKKGTFNALEFFNYVSERNGWKFEAKTEKEASDYLKEKEKDVKNKADLENICIRSTEGGHSRSYIYAVNSDIFLSKLEAIGFCNVYSDKFNQIIKKLREKEEIIEAKQRIISSAKKSFVKFNERTLEAIKKPEKAEKIGAFWENLLKEDSLRAKILKKLDDSYSYNRIVLERDELRKILKLS